MSNVFPDRREQYLEKSLPSNEEAEKTILGAILLDNNLIAQAASALVSLDFYSPLNRRVFHGMLECRAKGIQIDPITIGEVMKAEGSLESIGGTTLITNLTFGMPHFSDIAEYIKIVKEKSVTRQLIRESNSFISELLAEEEPLDKVLHERVAKLLHMRAQTARDSHASIDQVITQVHTIFDAWQAGNEGISSIKTGIPELDGFLKYRGLAKGELTLIGARPSTGKTALMLQMATNAVRMKVPTLFMSLEMLKEKLVMRMLPAITGIPNKAINPQTLKSSPAEAQKLFEGLNTLKGLPMYFDRAFELPKLIASAEYFIQTKGVELVVFDYLTLIKLGIISRRQDTRDAEVGQVTDAMKELGLRNNVAVLGGAQMNRESEKLIGKPPKMSHFRESGAIEQIVDVALLPYDPNEKDNIANPERIRDSIWLELYCDKQRDGQRYWSIPVHFDKNMQTFETMDMKANNKYDSPREYDYVSGAPDSEN